MLYHEIEKLELEIERLRNELTERIHMCDMRSEKIIELTAERDEARRKFCRTFVNPHIEAASRGWDCFKEEQ
jgi:hypothetical protein